MQRRAAAIYFVLFLAIGAGSFAYISVVDAQKPQINVQGERLQADDTLRIGDRVYIASVSGGSGELAWTNQSAQATGTLDNNATTTYNNQSWQVVIENGTDVSAFELHQQFNVSAILMADSAVENETVTSGGEKQVVFRQNQTLKPLDEYLPAPETRTFAVGDSYQYPSEEEGVVDATVSNVTSSAAEFTWTSPSENTISLTEGANVTLGDRQYVAHFPSNDTVVLSENVEGYMEAVDRQEYFSEREEGLWGVSIISFATAIVLLGAAYLPVKD